MVFGFSPEYCSASPRNSVRLRRNPHSSGERRYERELYLQWRPGHNPTLGRAPGISEAEINASPHTPPAKILDVGLGDGAQWAAEQLLSASQRLQSSGGDTYFRRLR